MQIIMAAILGISMACPHYSMVPKDFDANLKFRRDMLTMAGQDELAAAQLRQICSEDILFYMNVFCWTYDPRQVITQIPFITYEFQDNAISEMVVSISSGDGDITMPKSRCMGASWMGLGVYEWFWHFRDGLSFLLVSRNEDYVDKSGDPKSLFWKIDFIHQNQPKWLLPSGRWLGDKDPNRKKLHLANADNGSVIDGESTTGDAGRGDRRTSMFIDEHAAFDLNDGFKILRATRDTTKCRIFNSTPQGATNAFYEVVHNTAAKMIKMHWTEHPIYNKGLYTSEGGQYRLLDDFSGEVKISRKGEKGTRLVQYPGEYPFICDGKLRSVWYDNECARCVSEMEIAQELDIDFLGSDYQFFDPVTIDMLIKQHGMVPFSVGDIEYDRESLDPIRYNEHIKGKLKLWLRLERDNTVSRNRKFIVSSDVSAGTGASNSVTSITDRATGEKIGVWVDSHTRPIEFADISIAIARFFNNAYMIWDASGPTGKTFGYRVIDKGYRNVYYRQSEGKIVRRISDEPGYFLNPDARTALLEEYRNALGKQSYINHSVDGLKECLNFIVQPGGSVQHSKAVGSQDPSGARTAHGDEVIADALGNKALHISGATMASLEQDVPVGCLAWRRQQKKIMDDTKKAESESRGWL